MIFGLKTDKDEAVLNFYIETNKRLGRDDVVKNPFGLSKIGFIMREDKVYLVCDLNPVWPDFSGYLFIIGFIPLLFGFFKTSIFFYVLGLIVLFLWSRYFFSLMMYLGLRKKGYKGKIRLVKDQELLKVVTYG